MEFWYGPDNQTLQIIKDDLKEDEDRIENNLGLLKEWISYQKCLPQNYDPRMLPIFLRGCKNDLEKAKRKIALFFIAKSQTPELFANHEMSSESYNNVLKSFDLVVLPQLTPAGYRVIIFKIGKGGADIFDIQNIIKRNINLHEIQNVEETQNAGYIFIVDDNNFTAQHLTKTLHPIVKKAARIGQEALPFRVKQIHIVNANTFVIKAVNVIKTFMKEKIRNRFYIHKESNELQDFIPSKLLPADYGGTAPPISKLRDTTELMFRAKLEYLQAQENVKCLYIPDQFEGQFVSEGGHGVAGSFRKLNLD